MNERILAVFPQENDRERLVVIARETLEGTETVLRQESRCDTGWFVQSEISASPQQMAGLKVLLTSRSTKELLPKKQDHATVLPIGQHVRRRA